MNKTSQNIKDMHIMILVYIGGNLDLFVLSQDVYIEGDSTSRIL